MKDKKFDLGFTFSFPCVQKGLTHATLVRWTKGFSADGVEGHNVAELLQNELDKRVSAVAKSCFYRVDFIKTVVTCCKILLFY